MKNALITSIKILKTQERAKELAGRVNQKDRLAQPGT